MLSASGCARSFLQRLTALFEIFSRAAISLSFVSKHTAANLSSSFSVALMVEGALTFLLKGTLLRFQLKGVRLRGLYGASRSVRVLGAGRPDQRLRVRWPAGVAVASGPPARPPAGHPLGCAVMSRAPWQDRERALSALSRASVGASRCCLLGDHVRQALWERAEREALRVLDSLPGGSPSRVVVQVEAFLDASALFPGSRA